MNHIFAYLCAYIRLLAVLALVTTMAFACQAKVCVAERPDQDVLACLRLTR